MSTPTNYHVDVWAKPDKWRGRPGEWLRIKGVMDLATALLVAQFMSLWLGYARITVDGKTVLEMQAGLPRGEA